MLTALLLSVRGTLEPASPRYRATTPANAPSTGAASTDTRDQCRRGRQSARDGSAFLAAEAGEGRSLFHPRREQAFVDVVHGFQLDAARVHAHPDRRDRGHRREARAATERQLDVAGEATAGKAPSVAHAVH